MKPANLSLILLVNMFIDSKYHFKMKRKGTCYYYHETISSCNMQIL